MVAAPVCPCCKRPHDAVLERVARNDRRADMWRCPHCNASWMHRPLRKTR